MIADNLKSVTQRIARCCEKIGRSPESVKLICVVKGMDIDKVRSALDLGATDLGENRVQEAGAKYADIGDRARWHLVGHLQTNKVKDALRIFSLIHSVDSIHLAQAIDKEAGKMGKRQDILIQVNTSGEKTKFGLVPGDVAGFLKEAALYPNINIKGLMTIAPEVKDPEVVRPCFKALRELKDKINSLKLIAYSLQLLSMGMTNDFEVAIEEGSTMVRIGRAIFGDRA
jgi:pyridoxal phosphate enzyme (YggS family)